MDKQTMVSVMNRYSGTVGYTLADSGIHRTFARGESKTISIEELEQLSWSPGGDYILQNYLIIKDKNALEFLNMQDVEPEYFYTEADVRKLLEEGTLAQLEDTLNFGTAGVLELIKDIAVQMEIPDTRKRKLISDKLGFNIDTAIHINNLMNAEEEPADKEDGAPKRKASPITETSSTPQRKATTAYKIKSE